MKTRASSLYSRYRNLILYALIGGTGALLDLVVFLILFNALHLAAVPATVISVLFGITNNFALNTIFNFKKTDRLLLRYTLFTSVGLFGLILSALILAFGEVFAINPNLAKVLSIPLVVIAQYILNRHMSFKDFGRNFTVRKFIKVFWSRHWGLIIINIVFVVSALFMIKSIPPVGVKAGPDEVEHFRSNVEFIATNHRLPISGIDDKGSLQTCRANLYGAVPCRYSYVVYPAANYIVSATVGTVVHDLSGVSLLKGARVASMLWGVLFINVLYLMAHRLTRRRKLSWAVASIGLLPQVIFISSYINQDIHSLAISALCAYALVALLQDRSRASVIFAGLCFGALLPLAKYNYFILAPIIAIVIGYVTFVSKSLPYRLFFGLCGATILAFAVISAFWYIRNYLLYHDVFGQSFVLKEMSQYAPLGRVLPFDAETLAEYTKLGFFSQLFNSFFLSFGYTAFLMPEANYAILQAILFSGLLYLTYLIYSTRSRSTTLLLLFVWLLIACVIGLSLYLTYYNAVVYDFQSQGRYLYPILAPIACALAFSFRLDRRFTPLIYGLLGVVLYCLFHSIFIILAEYIYTA